MVYGIFAQPKEAEVTKPTQIAGLGTTSGAPVMQFNTFPLAMNEFKPTFLHHCHDCMFGASAAK